MADRKLKKKLIEKRQNVKIKLEQLKHGEMLQEHMFNPITKHLINIESSLQNSRNIKPKNVEATVMEEEGSNKLVKSEQQHTPKTVFPRTSLSTLSPQERLQRKLSTFSTPGELKQSIIDEVNSEDDLDDDDGETAQELLSANRLQNIADSSFLDYLEQYDPLPRKYISAMYEDDNNEFDHKYGVRLDTTTEKFRIGDSHLDINGSDVYVKGRRYKGTQGLYELLFKKYPNENLLNKEDLQNYKQIVYKTNAHKRYYKPNAQIDGSKLKKYKKMIAPTPEGKGLTTMMEVTGNKKDYIYWDDPNELVDRLRLLVSSQAAGHTGHTNEINSLIEELREADIIV